MFKASTLCAMRETVLTDNPSIVLHARVVPLMQGSSGGTHPNSSTYRYMGHSTST